MPMSASRTRICGWWGCEEERLWPRGVDVRETCGVEVMELRGTK